MKTQEEIEQLAEEFTNGHYHYRGKDAFIHAYAKCQEDMADDILDELEKFAIEYEKSMADKKYTEEDLMSAFNAGINNDYGNGLSFDQWLNSLNKQS